MASPCPSRSLHFIWENILNILRNKAMLLQPPRVLFNIHLQTTAWRDAALWLWCQSECTAQPFLLMWYCTNCLQSSNQTTEEGTFHARKAEREIWPGKSDFRNQLGIAGTENTASPCAFQISQHHVSLLTHCALKVLVWQKVLISQYETILFDLVFTTLQSIMNASKHGFWHCHENGLIKTIQTIPHNL